MSAARRQKKMVNGPGYDKIVEARRGKRPKKLYTKKYVTKGTDMTMQNTPDQVPAPEETGDTKQPDPGQTPLPDDNVDQDGHCIRAAYAEATGPNTGAPCDDGRSGGQ